MKSKIGFILNYLIFYPYIWVVIVIFFNFNHPTLDSQKNYLTLYSAKIFLNKKKKKSIANFIDLFSIYIFFLLCHLILERRFVVFINISLTIKMDGIECHLKKKWYSY